VLHRHGPALLGMLPCKSSKVCILTAALRRRNFAHENSDRRRSMVVESRASLLQIDANRIAGMQPPGDGRGRGRYH